VCAVVAGFDMAAKGGVMRNDDALIEEARRRARKQRSICRGNIFNKSNNFVMLSLSKHAAAAVRPSTSSG
jgi:hypothetical protein